VNSEELTPQPLPDDLADAWARVQARQGTLCPRLVYFSLLPSTNDVAARLADAGAASGTTVIADTQTAGRGRVGRTWFSPPGAGLYVSVVVRFGSSRVQGGDVLLSSLLTLTAGVGLAEGVRIASGLPIEIRWPNDLVVGRRKLGGILAEASGTGSDLDYVVLGFGLNVRSAGYPPDIADRATSIEAELGRAPDRGVVLAESLSALAARRADLAAGRIDDILAAWQDLAPSCRGASVEWRGPDGILRGTTAGIDERGALLVHTASGVERVIAGEIVWK
jgi:BirA family biotin operon repressor/biotin-[acetyl-CoA-carboxylase] ligase